MSSDLNVTHVLDYSCNPDPKVSVSTCNRAHLAGCLLQFGKAGGRRCQIHQPGQLECDAVLRSERLRNS